jgi:hypothetical protein
MWVFVVEDEDNMIKICLRKMEMCAEIIVLVFIDSKGKRKWMWIVLFFIIMIIEGVNEFYVSWGLKVKEILLTTIINYVNLNFKFLKI